MNTLKLQVSSNTINVTQCPKVITSGTVGFPVEISFDDSWKDLDRLVLFRADDVTVTTKDPKVIPWEVLEKPRVYLQIGVYGINADGTYAIPTMWTSVCMISVGTDPEADPAMDPTLPVWQELLDRVEDLEESGGGGGGDGFSPIANVTQTENGAIIRIEDKNGQTEATVKNGQDGFSPKVSVSNSSGGHEVVIEDAEGPHRFFVDDGVSPDISVYEVDGGYNIDITHNQGQDRVFIQHGKDGKDGISVTNAFIDDVGELAIEYSDGGSVCVGQVVPRKGEDYYTDEEKAELVEEISGVVKDELVEAAPIYTHIKTITTTEVQKNIIFADLNLDAFVLFVDIPADGTLANSCAIIFNKDSKNVWQPYVTNAISASNATHFAAYGRNEKGLAFLEYTNATLTSATTQKYINRAPFFVEGNTPFTKVSISATNGFPIGTKAELWGIVKF